MKKSEMRPHQLSATIERTWKSAPLSWVRRIQTEPNVTMTVLSLPEDKLPDFSPERGYWFHAAFCRTHDGQPCLIIQLNSFALAGGPGHGWAIPFAAEAVDEETRFRQELGFDEGWEASTPELILRLGRDWAEPIADLLSARSWAITASGHSSAYPMPIMDPMREAMKAFLAAVGRRH
jgi:hypothetical protein